MSEFLYDSTEHVEDHAVPLYHLVEHRFEFGKENKQLFGRGDRLLMVFNNMGVWNGWGLWCRNGM